VVTGSEELGQRGRAKGRQGQDRGHVTRMEAVSWSRAVRSSDIALFWSAIKVLKCCGVSFVRSPFLWGFPNNFGINKVSFTFAVSQKRG
jgi:hypothetical protein